MKRTIPRDRHEFDEFLGPLVEARQWDTLHERLISYWKRKGRSSLSAMVISPWVVLASVKGAVRIDVRFLLEHFHYGGVRDDDFYAIANEAFYAENTSVKDFLSLMYCGLAHSFPQDFKLIPRPIEEMAQTAPRVVRHTRGWEYAFQENRADVAAREYVDHLLKALMEGVTEKWRDFKGLPPVVSKWRSEQELLDALVLAFPDDVVVGQGSPSWLGSQRFDVWIPTRQIAVEYNGLQHYEPVEIFGGEEGFAATKKRDELKRRKCAENDVILFEVAEGYSLKKLVDSIASLSLTTGEK